MIYAVYATDAVRPPNWSGFKRRAVYVGEVEARNTAEAEARGKETYPDELKGKGIRVEMRR